VPLEQQEETAVAAQAAALERQALPIEVAAAAVLLQDHLALAAQELSSLDTKAHNVAQVVRLHHLAVLLFIRLLVQGHTQHEPFC
jgi:hypothetical protein